VTLIDHAGGAQAALMPDMDAAALLPGAGFVLAPELRLGRLGMRRRDRVQGRRKAAFLNRSCAAGLALGWRDRVFCQERSSDLTSRRMPPSR